MTQPKYRCTVAEDLMDAIAASLVYRGRATRDEIAKDVGRKEKTIAVYLRRMAKVGRAICAEQPIPFQGGSTPAVWVPGLGEVPKVPDGSNQTFNTNWQRGAARPDPLALPVAFFKVRVQDSSFA